MIGNDIIDIKETKRCTNWERPRFLQKIFTTEEQSIIKASADPFTSVWQLWSMKESAYKVFIQAGGNRSFQPTKLECRLHTSTIGNVTIENTILHTNTTIHSEYIFSTATKMSTDPETSIFKIIDTTSAQQSHFMYNQIVSEFAKKHLLSLEDLSLQKTIAGVPKLYYKKKCLDVSISMSHHGRYGAYSTLTNESMDRFIQ